MSYRLVVSEKPSVAMAYAKVLGATRRNDGYLEGDHYFHIACPNHNLDRARTQFTLVRQMEDVFDQMTAIVCSETDL